MSGETKCACACDSAPKLIFTCAGAADVGAIADQAARQLSREGAGSMVCLAGISGKVPGIVKSTEAAGAVLVIDGCPIDCARKTMEAAGFTAIEHLQVADLGFKKGRTPVTKSAISAVVAKGVEILARVGG